MLVSGNSSGVSVLFALSTSMVLWFSVVLVAVCATSLYGCRVAVVVVVAVDGARDGVEGD